MNGVHDMGGMQDMGPSSRKKNEPVFHHPWEGRVFAMYLATGAWGKMEHRRRALLERADSPGRLPAHELLRKMVHGARRAARRERSGDAQRDRGGARCFGDRKVQTRG